MKFRIDLPEIGCYCERAVDSRLYMYCFHILSEKCVSEITVPSEVDRIPITEVMVEYERNPASIERLRFCVEMKLIDADNFAELPDYSVYRNRTEFTALLLDYKNRNFPEPPFALDLE